MEFTFEFKQTNSISFYKKLESNRSKNKLLMKKRNKIVFNVLVLLLNYCVSIPKSSDVRQLKKTAKQN
ncbi:hypothetical protein LEP1GSC024_0617 [Leptospira noguchii str. 2001034031]|uniref:Uncharacterized protein n=1 Tax=Leptospira noguchii str. 2001034031 TaxID=1193053 RepID=M6YLA6_9LEPT|nr:hypothetical protein LEP1GSC024_0617 [Leptospira noguchii str. 2001034031]